ncbi:PstS family phosphate ABC transporter substrate-binding protein [Gloeothece verrucosa]|uniref:Phosphate ABC-transporter periplasmic phosphate-binding protein n=1 Tax=Gloeothece verrucosa (strain PCC 7822) TaxID=497965 RepID=E0UAJ9_GLOV7|nr:PstS family phosphate ABC transporter substrate-binding protein [Gloeothece verrucosa]ADN12740.1 phosphate ABC-transporter periplasmic phosphate-binding protein [Gloeothece verrucosa PCC 7822]
MVKKNTTILVLLGLLVAAGFFGAISWLILSLMGGIAEKKSIEPAVPPLSSDFALTTVERLNDVKNVPQGLFNYGGSTSWVPIQAAVNPFLQILFPQFILRYTNPVNGKPGSGTGIKMLLENQLSFALSSRPLIAAEYQQAKNQGFNFEEIPVAIDAIAIAVHPTLNIPGLTISQLKDIYTGKIINWSQVGGPDLPITPYSRLEKDSGTVEFFVQNILEREAFTNNLVLVSDTSTGLQKLSKNPGGIYYASAPEIVPQCGVKALPIGQKLGEWKTPYQEPFIPLSHCPAKRNQVNNKLIKSGEYPITRRLFVIVKGDKSIDEQAGRAYANLLLTKEGQELINKSGFVSLR